MHVMDQRWVVIAALLLAAGTARAAIITMDGDVSDWDLVPKVTDPIGDDTFADHDLAAVAYRNDGQYLYFYVAVDGTGGDYFGNSTRSEDVTIYLDTDNNAGTGLSVGPTGQKVGAEFALRAVRRVSSGSNFNSLLYNTGTGDPSYAGGLGGTFIGTSFGGAGLPPTSTPVVTEWEMAVPLSSLSLQVGDSLRFMVRTSRSGETPVSDGHEDWLDTAQSLTLVPEPGSAGMLLLGLIGVARRGRDHK